MDFTRKIFFEPQNWVKTKKAIPSIEIMYSTFTIFFVFEVFNTTPRRLRNLKNIPRLPRWWTYNVKNKICDYAFLLICESQNWVKFMYMCAWKHLISPHKYLNVTNAFIAPALKLWWCWGLFSRAKYTRVGNAAPSISTAVGSLPLISIWKDKKRSGETKQIKWNKKIYSSSLVRFSSHQSRVGG